MLWEKEELLWEKEELLVTRNFPFSHSIFKTCTADTKKKKGLVLERVNPLPDNKIIDWSKLKQIADNISKCF